MVCGQEQNTTRVKTKSEKHIPLAPAFAITSHAAQGQTLSAAIVEFNVRNPLSSYIGGTRIRTREDLIIFRPFPHTVYTQGSPEGPDILLKVWRGESVDWAALEENKTPQRRCSVCSALRFKFDFTRSQWRSDDWRYCIQCYEHNKNQGKPLHCSACLTFKGEEAFAEDELRKHTHRVCVLCVKTRQCAECKKRFEEMQFTPDQWVKALKRSGKCFLCVSRNQTVKLCHGPCKEHKHEAQFGATQWRKRASFRICLECAKRSRALKLCNGPCAMEKDQSQYSQAQWKNAAGLRVCIACTTAARNKLCNGPCRQSKSKESYSDDQWRRGIERVCLECASKHQENKMCSGPCRQNKSKESHSHYQWQKRGIARVCIECGKKKRGDWKCVGCGLVKPKT